MKALIIGGNGQIGASLIDYLLTQNWDVVATTRQALPETQDRLNWIKLDFLEIVETGKVELPACDCAFVCAAITELIECRQDPAMSQVINVEAPCMIAQSVVSRGGRNIFLSSSAVFSGDKPFCRPDDIADGRSVYGRQKQEAERRLMAIDQNLAILRLAKVLTPDMPLIAGWINDLRHDKTITPFDDKIFAPISIDQVINALETIAKTNMHGIFQLSADRDISYADCAYHIADRLDCAKSLVKPQSAAIMNFLPEESFANTVMDMGTLRTHLGRDNIDPLTVIDKVFNLTSGKDKTNE